MAIVTYPLNNINYSAEDAELFHCTRTSGVFASDEDFLASVTGADNIVTIGQGIAWIRNSRFAGKVVANKEPVSIDMGLADGTYDRIDAVVLRFDANANATEIVKKQGVASSSPTPPEVVQTEAVYELHLYHIRRVAGAASISPSNVVDLREDRNYCGIMSDDVTILGENFVSKDMVGVAGGVASLNSSGQIPSAQIPSLNYIPTSQKGAANGVATLDSNKKLPYNTIQTISKDVAPTFDGCTEVSYPNRYFKLVRWGALAVFKFYCFVTPETSGNALSIQFRWDEHHKWGFQSNIFHADVSEYPIDSNTGRGVMASYKLITHSSGASLSVTIDDGRSFETDKKYGLNLCVVGTYGLQ